MRNQCEIDITLTIESVRKRKLNNFNLNYGNELTLPYEKYTNSIKKQLQDATH